MKTTAKRAIRRKPCPYCEKRLVASTKAKFRYNLARHLRGCTAAQRHWIDQVTKWALDFLAHHGIVPAGEFAAEFLPIIPPVDVQANAKRDIEELERLAKLEPK